MTMHQGLIDQSAKFKKRVASADIAEYKTVSRGQLVVGFPIDEGVLDFQDLYDVGIVSPAYGIWDLKQAVAVDRNYLKRFLRSPRAMAYYKARLRGSTARRRSLPSDVFLALEVPMAPIEEQRRIAAILDRADELRDKHRRAVTRMSETARAIFLEMFSSHAGRTATVDEIALQAKGSIRTGPFGSQLLHSEFTNEGVAVLGLDNVVGNEFTWGERRFITAAKYQTLRRYTVKPGDVLVSIMGTCGRCVVVPNDVGNAINTKHICAITLDPDVAVPEFVRAAFLWHPMSRQHLAQRTKGSIMDGLNMGIIKEMPLPLPERTIQREFVARLKTAAGLSITLGRSENELDELFASLQSRAFSGQL